MQYTQIKNLIYIANIQLVLIKLIGKRPKQSFFCNNAKIEFFDIFLQLWAGGLEKQTTCCLNALHLAPIGFPSMPSLQVSREIPKRFCCWTEVVGAEKWSFQNFSFFSSKNSKIKTQTSHQKPRPPNNNCCISLRSELIQLT